MPALIEVKNPVPSFHPLAPFSRCVVNGHVFARRSVYILLACCLLALLAACGSTAVEPGYYRVERGDTLSRIAARHGQSVASLVRWNKLANPNQIEVGQLLRIAAPGSGSVAATPSRGTPGKPVQVKPPAAPVIADVAPASRIALAWPAAGNVVRAFNSAGAKGMTIVNTAGTPVLAAAPGTVAYAGEGLRGYGKLIILQHPSDFLTIYAHNRSLAVTEGQRVKQGQKIAEMGNTDASRVQLYFELRYKGQPTDPARSLPKR